MKRKETLPPRDSLDTQTAKRTALDSTQSTGNEMTDECQNSTQNLDDVRSSSGMSLICKQAPSFSTDAVMPDGSFGKVSLADSKGKWTVLVFYPLAFTFACTSALTLISDRKAEFDAINATVVFCSVDSIFANHAWTQVPRTKGGIAGMTFPIASDLSKTIGQDYQCLIGDGHHCRATYIIDPNGVVRHLSMNDPPVERNVDEMLRIIQGYQSHEENGEVCPANWRKGGKTIKTDVVKKNEYFEAVHGQ